MDRDLVVVEGNLSSVLCGERTLLCFMLVKLLEKGICGEEGGHT